MQYRDPDEAELLRTLTTPETAKSLWRSPSAAGRKLRQDFDGQESTFLAYIGAIQARRGTNEAKSAWASYAGHP
ncbi:hypothetical protein [Nitrospira sp. Nam74]